MKKKQPIHYWPGYRSADGYAYFLCGVKSASMRPDGTDHNPSVTCKDCLRILRVISDIAKTFEGIPDTIEEPEV